MFVFIISLLFLIGITYFVTGTVFGGSEYIGTDPGATSGFNVVSGYETLYTATVIARFSVLVISWSACIIAMSISGGSFILFGILTLLKG